MNLLKLKGDIPQSFQGKHFIRILDAQNWKLAAQPVYYFSRFLGKNIKICPPGKLLFFTSLDDDNNDDDG